MKLDNSNKRFSIIIAGILVISVLSIVMAFCMGYRDSSIYEQNRGQLVTVNPFNSDQILDCCKGSKKFESVTQSNSWDNVDVKKGSVTLTSAPWDACGFDMPICVDYEDVNTWSILFESVGGYHPLDVCNNFKLQFYQLDKNDPNEILKLHGDYYINFDPTYMSFVDVSDSSTPCGTQMWELQFSITDDTILFVEWDEDGDLLTVNTFTNCMVFDSNHKPTGSCCKLNKEVSIELVTCWAGCGCRTQEFEVILIHKK